MYKSTSWIEGSRILSNEVLKSSKKTSKFALISIKIKKTGKPRLKNLRQENYISKFGKSRSFIKKLIILLRDKQILAKINNINNINPLSRY
jgi:hypothetical protein